MKYSLPVMLGILAPVVALAGPLEVPFTMQAPNGDWSQPWQDACEEATIAMTDAYYSSSPFHSISDSKERLMHAMRIKESAFGYSLDENAEKIATLINGFYSFEAHVVENPSVAMMKEELNQGRPIILPTYGKALRNRHFIGEGPDYHTLVISGYDDETREFITQEPGTKHGLDFRYSYDTLHDAMHDVVPGKKTYAGRKVAIFTRPSPQAFLDADLDKDGLTKEDELKYGTVLFLADSDGDGYSDGEEVANGYSPTINESRIVSGVVRTANSPSVFHLRDGMKHPIASEAAFLQGGWNWSDIALVSEKYLSHFEDGSPIID